MSQTMPKKANSKKGVKVTFHPQIWDNNSLSTSDDLEKFVVPLDEAENENGELPEDNSYESDLLREHPNAPTRVRNWEGPFRVTLDEIVEMAETQAETVEVTFHPQLVVDGELLDGDNTATFSVPASHATDQEGNLIDGKCRESDLLREHENAPERAQKWSGQFYVTLEWA